MDTYSSGEELVKARKPYTITKQRERWTDEEHERFLEALKLYGRAWQRIEEHIGTKTAVQIRSHAQKFFTKLEKEAVVKGVPVGDAFNIDIPPPRPKRKPNNPYPRKSCVGVKDGKLPIALDLEKETSTEKTQDPGKLGNPANSTLEKGSVSEVSPFLKAVSGANQVSGITSSTSVALGNACLFRENVSLSTETHEEDEIIESHVTYHAKQSGYKQLLHDDVSFNTSKTRNLNHSHEKLVYDQERDEYNQSKSVDTCPSNNVQASQNCPRHVPVHILDGSFGINAQNSFLGKSCVDNLFHKVGGFYMNQAVPSASDHHSNVQSSYIHQPLPDFHPLSTIFQHQDDYQSFTNISSMFSSLIVATLLQNPAAHAAATFAATLWPCKAVESPEESCTGTPKGFQASQINVASSMAAIVASTVAAATSWWAAHGLLPLCPPFHPGFTCSTPSASTTPISINTKAAKNERIEKSPGLTSEGQKLERECPMEFPQQHSGSKSLSLSSSSCSEASQGEKIKSGLSENETAQLVDTAEQLDSNKSDCRKQVDRSSCGSNTPSSSDVEAYGLEKFTTGKKEKHVTNEESEAQDESQSLNSIGRLCKSLSNANESWKAVSEEGRLAFQALFNREILPQSFSPRDLNFNRKKTTNKENTEESQLVSDHDTKLSCISMGESTCLNEENKSRELPNLELGYTKLETCRTGFKPYKRCSVEANKGRMSTNGPDAEKCTKRLRMEVEDSP